MADELSSTSEKLVGSGLPSVQYPKYIAQLGKVDKFFVRWFSFSPVAWSINRKNGLTNTLSPLILTTTGRKSGKQIDVVLPYYRDGENYAVIGSMAGQPKHPHWALNLMADPLCEIFVKGRKHKMRVHIAEGEERRRIWDKAVKEYRYYLDYAVSAYPREIPVVVLEKR
jgi:deazaflavin-dependent oxidoreductase (nitroreductase family)